MSDEGGRGSDSDPDPDPADVDVDALVARRGFDPDHNVLTRRQAEVYILRKREFRQADVAEILGTSRANVANVEASARENIRNARNTVAFADVLAAPIRVEIESGTPLYRVPQRVFSTCDDAGIEVDHTAPELMELVGAAAGAAVENREVVRPITVGVDADGTVRVTNRGNE
jgi:Tfx family DNA-binding protein